jgi:hypothetical protein
MLNTLLRTETGCAIFTQLTKLTVMTTKKTFRLVPPDSTLGNELIWWEL